MANVNKDATFNEDHSGNKSPVAAFLNHAILKAQENVQIDGNKGIELEREIERLIHDDRDMDRRVRELVMALKPVPIEPDRALVIRAYIRPFITISLTILFAIFLVVWVFGGDPDSNIIRNLKEMLPVFLGIYGSVIGFWFGEHTAQRNMQKQ